MEVMIEAKDTQDVIDALQSCTISHEDMSLIVNDAS